MEHLQRPKERIHPIALKAWRIQGILLSAIFLIIVIAYFITRIYVDILPLWIGIVALIVWLFIALLLIIIIPKIRMIYWGYQINEEDIDIQYGLIVIRRTLIPMNRIQHVDTEHGPILRFFKLATLSISTAGTKHKIPALLQARAEQLRQQISRLAILSDDDV